MAARKPLFLSASGYSEEMATTDSMTLGALTMGGDIDMNSAGKLKGSTVASTDGDALIYGQTGANLQDLVLDGASGLDLADTGKVTSMASATADGDALAYGQTGANLQDLVVDGASGIDLADTGKVTSIASATADGDALAYGQTGANLQDLVLDGASGLNMSSAGKITNLSSATADGDAIAYGQSGANLAGLDIDTADLTMNSRNITGLPATPSGSTAAASKAYVDSVAQGLDLKDAVAAATTANITLSNEQTVDGVGLVAGDRCLVKDQDTASQNGIYVVVDAGAWTRATDLAAGAHASGAFCFVEDGTDNGDAGFVCTTNGPSDVVGTNDLTFSQFSGAGQIEAGDGLTKDGNIIAAGAGDGIAVAADSIAVDLATNPGLQFTSNKLDLLLYANGGLQKDANGAAIKLYADQGLIVDSNGLAIDLASSNPGLQFSSGDLALLVKADTGLAVDASGVYAVPDTTKAMSVGASGLAVEVETDGAIEMGGNNKLQINLEASNPSLQIATNELGLKIYASGGLQKDANGTSIKIDDTPDTLDVDADGLKVVGLPSQFKINGSAVSSDVTHTNLNALTGGGETALHYHAETAATQAPKIENAIAVDEAVAALDPVYITATGDRVGKSITTNDTKAKVLGIARTAQATPGSNTNVVSHGPCTATGLTAGSVYWLDTAGGITATWGDIGAGERVIEVGVALSTTSLFVDIKDFGKKAS